MQINSDNMKEELSLCWFVVSEKWNSDRWRYCDSRPSNITYKIAKKHCNVGTGMSMGNFFERPAQILTFISAFSSSQLPEREIVLECVTEETDFTIWYFTEKLHWIEEKEEVYLNLLDSACSGFLDLLLYQVLLVIFEGERICYGLCLVVEPDIHEVTMHVGS